MATYQQDSASKVSAEADLGQPSDTAVIQCAGDNPRAWVPGTLPTAEPARAEDSTPETITPVIHLGDAPGQLLFFQSSWARRDARAKRLHGYIPALVYVLLIFIFILIVLA